MQYSLAVGRHHLIPQYTYPLRDPLFLIIPIHVDDGLGISNSLPLYNWFIMEMSKSNEIICQGPVVNTRYLGQRVVRDRTNKIIRFTQSLVVFESPVFCLFF